MIIVNLIGTGHQTHYVCLMLSQFVLNLFSHKGLARICKKIVSKDLHNYYCYAGLGKQAKEGGTMGVALEGGATHRMGGG